MYSPTITFSSPLGWSPDQRKYSRSIYSSPYIPSGELSIQTIHERFRNKLTLEKAQRKRSSSQEHSPNFNDLMYIKIENFLENEGLYIVTTPKPSFAVRDKPEITLNPVALMKGTSLFTTSESSSTNLPEMPSLLMKRNISLSLGERPSMQKPSSQFQKYFQDYEKHTTVVKEIERIGTPKNIDSNVGVF